MCCPPPSDKQRALQVSFRYLFLFGLLVRSRNDENLNFAASLRPKYWSESNNILGHVSEACPLPITKFSKTKNFWWCMALKVISHFAFVYVSSRSLSQILESVSSRENYNLNDLFSLNSYSLEAEARIIE